jgi:hypothetical protein
MKTSRLAAAIVACVLSTPGVTVQEISARTELMMGGSHGDFIAQEYG